MKNKDFQILIKKFYDGETSIQEEHFLYDYFASSDIPHDLEKDRKIFLDLYRMNDDVVVPQNLESDLNRLIDQLDEKDKKTKKINWKWAAGIAASILIVVSCSLYLLGSKNNDRELVDTYSDPREAYIAAQKALLLASNKLNKGFDQFQDVQNNLDKTNKELYKTFQK